MASPRAAFPLSPLPVVRAPADRPLSALLAIVALVATCAVLLLLVDSAVGGDDARLSARAEPAGEARP